MYIGVDIGGTKTLVGVLTAHGEIIEKIKFPTPKIYDEFILKLDEVVEELTTKDFAAGGVAVPGRLDRKHGRLIALGNLPWQNEPIQADCEKILNCPVVIENDSKLAGLSEAMLHPDRETVLYVTISTGISTAVVYKGKLDPAMINSEGGNILLPFRGKLVKWEKFASGHAIFEHFGKKASEITDSKDWAYVVRNISLGLFETISIVEPDIVIIGGSIGTYFDRYKDLLKTELKKYELPLVPIPPIIQAQRPEEAVVYGCYDLIRQVFTHAQSH